MPISDWTCVAAGIFHHFHHEWISCISRALNAGLLPPDYYALAEQVAGGLGPDVLTLESVRPNGWIPADDEPSGAETNGGVALAVAPPQVRFTASAKPDPYARKRSRIAVHHVSDDRVVAVVEIVSPGNKSTERGFRSFVEKAVEWLHAGIHLLVIDLFPPGPRDPQGVHAAIWSEMDEHDFQLPPEQPLTLVAYSAGEWKQAFIEPAAVGAALPDMPLFFEPERYVPVPLEQTYQTAFDAVPKRWRDELVSKEN